MLRHWWGRWKAVAAELGRANALLYVAGRGLAALSPKLGLYKYYLAAQAVPTEPRLPTHLGRHIAIRSISEGDSALQSFPVPSAVIEARFRQGAICLGAFKGDELMGYAWLLTGPYEEDEVRTRFVPLPAGRAAWDFDVYVEPRYRLSLVFLRLWDSVHDYMRAHGVAWSMSRISAFNIMSLMAHKRLGAQIVGSAIYIILGPCQVMWSTVQPFFHISLRATSVPTVHVCAPN
jgi:hypothetical protein